MISDQPKTRIKKYPCSHRAEDHGYELRNVEAIWSQLTLLDTVMPPPFLNNTTVLPLLHLPDHNIRLFSYSAMAQAGSENIQAHTSRGHF